MPESEPRQILNTLLKVGLFVLLEIVSRPRTQDEKRTFYANFCADLKAGCGIEATDVMISFVQNTDDDWSFGLGRAQFVEGDL